MLSLASLLNPAPPGPPINRFPPSPASSSSPTTSIPDESGLPEPMMPKQKIPRNTAVLPASRPKGAVNFYPHERLDEASLRQIRKFHVRPLGNIQDHARHIPYNSGKKDFYEKTGRESFEVFQYDFKIPGDKDDHDYTIMWDYNVGLVRMTPFFKCCRYPKTTPAKMLNMNPGLKEITHSITGGSIMAQGYWMPFQCAKAVCATFCHNIAGALIPIFGPDFPSLCTPSEAPEYQRMVIDPEIVQQCTRDAEHFRRVYSNTITSSSGIKLSPPRDRRPLFRNPYEETKHLVSHHRHHPVRKTYVSAAGYNSPYTTDTDNELSPIAAERGSVSGPRERFFFSPIVPPPPPPPPPPPSSVTAPLRPTTNGWTPANVVLPPQQQQHHYDTPGPSPWLSAVPRFTTADHLPPYHPSPRHQQLLQQNHQSHHHNQSHPPQRPPWRAGKRSAGQVEADEYEFENDSRIKSNGIAASTTGCFTPTTVTATTTATATPRGGSRSNSKTPAGGGGSGCFGLGDTAFLGADKNAALLLMNLSVTGAKNKEAVAAAIASETTVPCDGTYPRIKRIRANSM